MTLRKIESSLSQLAIALHDLARSTAEPAISARLRRIAHDVAALAEKLRRLLAALPLLRK